jgi:hypothetical protein
VLGNGASSSFIAACLYVVAETHLPRRFKTPAASSCSTVPTFSYHVAFIFNYLLYYAIHYCAALYNFNDSIADLHNVVAKIWQ